MIILISGPSHVGKTLYAQRLCNAYNISYLSIDLLKMGLIRSKQTSLSVWEDEQLCDYLWPIIKEMIKTSIENNQHLIMEGLYIPFDWKKDFDEFYRKHIQYHCLIMSKNYIQTNLQTIKKFANVIEKRLHDALLSQADLIRENEYYLHKCKQYHHPYTLIDKEYSISLLDIVKEE